MRSLLLASALGLTAISGCAKQSDDAQATTAAAEIPSVSVAELDAMLARSECTPVDANGERTRKRIGVIPGAVLLTDFETFKLAELPADKARPLVFYCANTACSASSEAAARARIAGHTNVKVMHDGISGWVKAGKKIKSI